MQGTFDDVAKSESKYATLLTREPEQTEEERMKLIEQVKINRQMSTKVSASQTLRLQKLRKFNNLIYLDATTFYGWAMSMYVCFFSLSLSI